jgi:ABC-2 type transport system permease protein
MKNEEMGPSLTSGAQAVPPPWPAPKAPSPPPSPEKTLRRLFLTLFLRGHSARGLRKEGAPKSVGQKLALTLLFYALLGCFIAFSFGHQSVFALSLYLHGATLMFLGMFVAASAGEVLFNQQEGDILLHRPVSPRALLWAKIGVLLQVSLWLAGAFNLAGLFMGIATPGGGWTYPLVHAISTALEALFCTGTVVLVYQLCLRWFGREKLDGLMTAAQMIVAIAAVAGGQIVPRLMDRFGGLSPQAANSWWLVLLPPAWFAGIDDALAGPGNPHSWVLGLIGVSVTAAVLWFAFGKLADNYVSGLQSLGESAGFVPKQRSRQRWLGRLVSAPPLSWWLRDSVSRASFQLTLAYLIRDRDVKLRVYPGLAPMLVIPVVMLMRGPGRAGEHAGDAMAGFGIAFLGVYLGLVPMLGLGLLQYSQHWQAADLFRVAPQIGPASIYHGARKAVLLLLVLPVMILFALLCSLTAGTEGWRLLLLLPGLIVLPLYALVPGVIGRAIPLSQPLESAKSANRSLSMIGVMLFSAILAGIATAAWNYGWFAWFLAVEIVAAATVYVVLTRILNNRRWPSME